MTSRISLTTDGWKPKHQNRSYFCLTCHFIDYEWKLHKRVIAFHVVPFPHHNINLSAWLKERILEWNIDRKLFSVVVDNASNNAGMLNGVKGWLNGKKCLVRGGEMFHLRCVPHILKFNCEEWIRNDRGFARENSENGKIHLKLSSERRGIYSCLGPEKNESQQAYSI